MSEAAPSSTQTTRSRPKGLGTLVKILIGLLFSALFIWLAVRDVDLDLIEAQAAQMRWPGAAAYGAITALLLAIRVWRWGITVRAFDRQLPWRRIFAVGSIGILAIFALPARMGELVRPVWISRDTKINFGQATATVVVERLLDGTIVTVMLFVTVLLLGNREVPEGYLYSGYAATLVFGGLTVGVVGASLLFPWLRDPLQGLLEKISVGLAERVIGTLHGFFTALRLIASPSLGVPYLATTLVLWAGTGVSLWCLFWTFPPPVGELDLIAGFAVLSVIVVGIMVPAGPTAAGVFHWAAAFGLSIFGVDDSAGLLYATVLHALLTVANLLLGGVGWVLSLTSPDRREARTS